MGLAQFSNSPPAVASPHRLRVTRVTESWVDQFLYSGVETQDYIDGYGNHVVVTHNDEHEGAQSLEHSGSGSSYRDSGNNLRYEEERTYADKSERIYQRDSNYTITPQDGYALNLTTQIQDEYYSSMGIDLTADSLATTPVTHYEIVHANGFDRNTKSQYSTKTLRITESSTASDEQDHRDEWTSSEHRALTESLETLINPGTDYWAVGDVQSKYGGGADLSSTTIRSRRRTLRGEPMETLISRLVSFTSKTRTGPRRSKKRRAARCSSLRAVLCRTCTRNKI